MSGSFEEFEQTGYFHDSYGPHLLEDDKVDKSLGCNPCIQSPI